MAETAVMKICEVHAKDKSVDEYVELRDRYLSGCGDVYSSRIRERKAVRKPRKYRALNFFQRYWI